MTPTTAVTDPRHALADGGSSAAAGQEVHRTPAPRLARAWLRGWGAIVHLVIDLLQAGFFLALVATAIGMAFGSALLIGLPVLVVVLLIAFAVVGVERWRIAIFLGTWVPPMPRRPAHLPFWRRVGLDPRPWRSLLYLTLVALWGLTGGLLVTTLLGAALAGMLLPLLPPEAALLSSGGIDVETTGVDIEATGVLAGRTLDAPTRLGLAVAGLLLLMLLPLLAWALAKVDVAIARLSIGTDPARQVAELNARVDTLTETRERAVDSVELERRRIERDLHDGPQQRLVAVAMDIGLARQRLATDPSSAAELLERAHSSAKEAVVDMRRVARGIHPPVLTDRGLDAALSALAARSPVPVSVHVSLPQRPAPRLEAIAYFSVSEALTNVAKHSRAASARVDVRQERCGEVQCLVATVTDDGVGGADPSRGTGLAGLRDRVRSVDGDVLVSSPPGGPTVLRFQLPLTREQAQQDVSQHPTDSTAGGVR